MYEIYIRVRNLVLALSYRAILKPFFFRRDPEAVHDRMVRLGARLGRSRWGRGLVRLLFSYRHPALRVEWRGITFQNPLGLAAGFDKNAELVQILPAVGFGFMEVGSITGEACPGNPRPRLWRVPAQKSLLVYYGLKNDGARVIAGRLRGIRPAIPLGINIAKTNCRETVETAAGIADYIAAYRAFQTENIGDYFTINISCPNAFGGEPFTNPERLEQLLRALAQEEKTIPIFLKLSPDSPYETIDRIIALAERYNVDGFICSNLTKRHEVLPPAEREHFPVYGGLSGKCVEEASNQLLSYLYAKTRGTKLLMGLGGVFTAEDAYEKIRRGAMLIQLITGMIYGGPQTIAAINQGLVRLLRRDGYHSIVEAVGTDLKNSKKIFKN